LSVAILTLSTTSSGSSSNRTTDANVARSRVTGIRRVLSCRGEMARPITAPTWLQQDLRGELPEAVRGDGIRIWDREGREYIDACSGAISVISIGHGVTEVADAVAEQARALAYVHSTQFRHPVGEELAERIVRHAPGSLNHACFYSGGSEAIEAAVKL